MLVRSTLRRALLHDLVAGEHELRAGAPLPGLERTGWTRVARQLGQSLRAEPNDPLSAASPDRAWS